VAVDDTASTSEDMPVTVNLLTNDTDADGDTLSVTNLTSPDNGTLVDNSDGTVTYTPNPGYNGTDSFTYRASDGTDVSTVATVTITVGAVNDPPGAADDAATTNEDALVTVDLLANDSDPDAGDTLKVTNLSTPANGSLVDNGDGTVTYTPDPDFNGTDTFTYTANDGTIDSNIATVTITVNPTNDPPVATDDATTTPADTPVTINVLSNDSDVDGDPLTVSIETQPTNGSAAVNKDGTITYTPGSGFSGTDTFTYTANDGNGGTDTATVTVDVKAAAATMYVGNLAGSSSTVRRGWVATATITVVDELGTAVEGATVLGSWAGTGGETTCVTDASGTCSVTSKVVKGKKKTKVTFTVDDITHGHLLYDPSKNSKTSVTIYKAI
jgi:hypothetical protein